MIKHAVILIAGKGTRFLPATKGVAKEMFPIGNKPALLYLLRECLDSGIEEVTLVSCKEKNNIKKFLKRDKELDKLIENTDKERLMDEWKLVTENLKINYVIQGKTMKGTAGGVYCIKNRLKNKPFAVLFGDDVYISDNGQKPALRQLIDVFNETGKYVLGCVQVPDEVVDRYGIAVIDGKYKGYDIVKGFKEKPKIGEHPSNLAALGRYIILPSIFDNILKTKPYKTGEYLLPEAIALECEKENIVACKVDSRYNDLGNKLEFVKCTVLEALKDETIKEQLIDFFKSLTL